MAARAAAATPDAVNALVMFGPVLCKRLTDPAGWLPPRREITVWEQYRAFIGEVPPGHPPVMADRHFDAWSRAYLASDAQACARQPPSVLTPTGPHADIVDIFQGKALFDPTRISQPILVVRGEWDSLCSDVEIAELLAAVSSRLRQDAKIPKATHRMHLEERRGDLHRAVNEFLRTALA